jgi:hypothetical protein
MAARGRLQSVDRATKYHPVSVAISKAQAAAWLLGELHHGDLALTLGVGVTALRHQQDPNMPLPQSEIHDWLSRMASDALFAGLAEAQAEFNKHQAAPQDGGA